MHTRGTEGRGGREGRRGAVVQPTRAQEFFSAPFGKTLALVDEQKKASSSGSGLGGGSRQDQEFFGCGVLETSCWGSGLGTADLRTATLWASAKLTTLVIA